MSRPLTSRLVAQSLFRAPRSTPLQCSFQHARPLSQTSTRWTDAPPPRAPRKRVTRPSSASLLENIYGTSQTTTPQASQPNAMASLTQSLIFKTLDKTSNLDMSGLSGTGSRSVEAKEDDLEPFHFHIHSHKHNTHITCTRPNREPIISMSCGNIGFRKSRRGTFDSAYSLTKYVLERLIHAGWPMKIARLEVVLRGFGQGREAALKVLMSPEGKVLRDKIVRVADSTRVKFAGTRSEKPRRL
ncbi:Fc.00g070620.m01.CDS01 [Cosmosporella sp. VM-42]